MFWKFVNHNWRDSKVGNSLCLSCDWLAALGPWLFEECECKYIRLSQLRSGLSSFKVNVGLLDSFDAENPIIAHRESTFKVFFGLGFSVSWQIYLNNRNGYELKSCQGFPSGQNRRRSSLGVYFWPYMALYFECRINKNALLFDDFAHWFCF